MIDQKHVFVPMAKRNLKYVGKLCYMSAITEFNDDSLSQVVGQEVIFVPGFVLTMLSAM